MAFDGIVTGAVVKELNNTLTGLRIDKIYQVEKDEVLIHFRKHKLLISSSGNNPRIYLTQWGKENPKTPPIFAMVLRKHLSGAIVKEVVQNGNDRVIKILFDAWNDFSEKTEKSLIIEIMGRHSNIILLDENDIIIDSIKRVNESMSRVRQILPHLPYENLLNENKIDPLTTSKEEVLDIIKNSEGNKSIENLLFHSFIGFSKNIGTEISTRSGLSSSMPIISLDEVEKEKLAESTVDLIQEINQNQYINKLYLDGDKIIDFHVLDLKNLYGLNYEEFGTPSELLDKVFRKRDLDDRLGQKSQALKKTINSKLSKSKSKLTNLEKELYEAENREKYRIYADILSANFHKVSPGQREITLENFYSEDLETISIPLDEKLSAPQNAQKFYKKYGKLKTAANILKTQIEETQGEVLYLDSVLSSIELTEDINYLDDIKDELIDEGYIKRSQKKKTNKKMNIAFKEYSKNGFKILLGRNNRENDILTHKEAKRDDLWLHAQGIPGSHVIIKTEGKEVPMDVIEYAAKIAAYNSKGRDSGAIEVDYTKKQYVKRHPGNKPGLVNYTDFQTVLVESNMNLED